MRLDEIKIIKEGYKEVKQKFISSNPEVSEQDIQSYIEKFRDLVNRNQLQGNEKNIDYWGKQGLVPFKEMVDLKSQQKSKTQTKRSKVKGESINLYEDDDWLIVIPLDKDASCFHGKNTAWCTTKSERTQFEDYFYGSDVTLIYFIRKKDLNKWAIKTDDSYDDIEYFNKNNDDITKKKFDTETGLKSKTFIKMAKKHEDKIQKIRDKVNEEKEELIEKIVILKGENDHYIENRIISLNDYNLLNLYIENVGESSNYTKKFQVKAVKEDPMHFTRYIKNPDKDVQMLAVKYDSGSIKYINNPYKDVQMAAVKDNYRIIRFIDNPHKEVQMFVVKKHFDAIEDIDNPHPEVQMASVKSDSDAIGFIDKPVKEVQMVAVKDNEYTIRNIDNPDKDVQLYVVNKNGNMIHYIDNPDKEVQMAAVKQNKKSIKYIKKPHPDVKKYMEENK